jgi:AraC-like DNA-binding protein
MHRGQFLLLDLNAQHSSVVPSDVDCISIYTSRLTIKQFQEEHDFPGTGQLNAPLAMIHEDIVVRNLGEALLPAITQQDTASRLYASHVSLALLARLTELHGIHSTSFNRSKGGLAPWQERRAKEILMAHLDGCISLEQLSQECRLSRAHFARAFKKSVGMSPLRWLNAKRLEHAQVLLLNTNLSLEQIATSCGFVDSSHFTRSFRRAEGLPPGLWRRERIG